MAPPAPASVVAVVLAAFTVASCSDTARQEQAFEVRDSAGIRIATSRAPSSAGPWTLDPQPVLDIGGDESDTTQILFRVAGAVALEVGGIVIAHGAAPLIRWFDAAGAYRFGAGRPGGGPGEFGSAEGAWLNALWRLPGDSVGVWEHSPRRMQVFDPAGNYVRTVVLELPPEMPETTYPQVVGRLDDGFVAFLIPPLEPGTVGEITRDSMTYIRYRADGTYAGEIARLPGFETFTQMLRTPDGRETKARGRPPYAKIPAAWPAGNDLVYGSADRYELLVLDSAGRIRTLIRREHEVRAVTAELIAANKAATMARAPDDPTVRRRWEESVNAAPYPESLPGYRRARVDYAGRLWVQDYGMPGADSVTWSIFDDGGRWLGQLAMPADWEVLDIDEKHLVVLVRDELDVEHVRVHAFQTR